jgi:hypothetical protein
VLDVVVVLDVDGEMVLVVDDSLENKLETIMNGIITAAARRRKIDNPPKNVRN